MTARTTVVRDAPTPRRRLIVTMVALIAGQLIASLNATLVTAALPAIILDLDATTVQGTWLITIAVISMAVAAPIWGRLGDQINPVFLLRIALAGILVAAIIAATAQDPIVLLVSRAVHALSLSGVMALTMILFALLVSPRERGKYMGWMSAVSALGMMGGPFLGGLIVESPLGWRGVFAIAVPLALLILVLLQFSGAIQRDAPVNRARIDFVGGGLIAAGVASVLVYISFRGSAFEATSFTGLSLLGAGIVALIVALVVELRHENPILPIRALRGRVPRLAAIAVLSVGMTGFPLALFITLYLQSGRGLRPSEAGLILAASAVGSVLSSFLVGNLATRTGRLRPLLIVGGTVLVAGSTLLSLVHPDTAIWWLALVLFISGIGQGMTQHFTVLAAQNAVPLNEVGRITGFMSFLQTLGGAVLMSVLGGVLQLRLVDLTDQGMSLPDAYATTIPQFFPVTVLFAAIALSCYVLLPAIRLRSTIDTPAGAPEEGEAGHPEEARP